MPPAAGAGRARGAPRRFARPVSLLLFAAAMAIVAVGYGPAARAPFVFDDFNAIESNESLRRLWPLPLEPPVNTAVSGRPVANVSFAASAAINRALEVDQRRDPDGPNKTVAFRVLNMLLHAANGTLLLLLIRAGALARGLTESRADLLAIAASATWLVHPLHTDAVNYIVQRTELLVSFFLLLTLTFTRRSILSAGPTSRWMWGVAAVASCGLGMATKENMVVAPLLVVLFDRAFLSSDWRSMRTKPRVLLYSALVATSVWRLATIDSRMASVGYGLGMTWYEYFYSQCWAILHYLRLAIWPDPLVLDYGSRAATGLRGLPGLIILGFLGAATVVAWTRATRWGWLGFLGAWFFLILAPSSSFVPIVTEIAAERRMYLPLASFTTALAVLVLALWNRHSPDGHRRVRPVVWVVIAACVGLLARTTVRSIEFRDPERLWRGSIMAVPDNPRAYDNLAVLRYRADRRNAPEAVALLRQAAAVDTAYAPAWFKLGTIAMNAGQAGSARQYLERALSIDPEYRDALGTYGSLLLTIGDTSPAIRALEKASSPPAEEPLIELGQAYAGIGRTSDAIRSLSLAVQFDPPQPGALSFLGALLIESGRAREAVPHLVRATELEPAVAKHHALLAVACAVSGQPQRALASAEVAGRLYGGDPTVLLFSGRALLIAGRPDLAELHLSEAVRISGTDVELMTMLGDALQAQGKLGEALAAYRRALAISPGFEPARVRLRALQPR